MSEKNITSGKYFQEYANGLGYLNAIRKIPNSGTPPRYAVQLSVIQGPEDNVHYEYHDLTVSTEQALRVIFDHKEAIENEDSKVLIRFKMVNPRARAFQYESGEKQGQLGSVINGFLTRITSMKVDGELVFKEEQPENLNETQAKQAVT